LRVTELGAELGLAKSTIHKLLQTLLRRGYAVQEPASGRYRLGLKFLELAELSRAASASGRPLTRICKR